MNVIIKAGKMASKMNSKIQAMTRKDISKVKELRMQQVYILRVAKESFVEQGYITKY